MRMRLGALTVLLACALSVAAKPWKEFDAPWPTKSVAPAPLNWVMRGPNDTYTEQRKVDQYGAEHRYVEHLPLKNVTAQMFGWFSLTLQQNMKVEFAGQNFSTFYLYHPLCHNNGIYKTGIVIPDKKTGKNQTYTYIREFFFGDYTRSYANCTFDYLLEQYVMPNGTGSSTILRLFDVIVFNRTNLFKDGPDGLRMTTHVTLGEPSKKGEAINKYIKGMFCEGGGFDAYWRHVIEETGNLEFFLPQIFRKYAVRPPSQASSPPPASGGYRRKLLRQTRLKLSRPWI